MKEIIQLEKISKEYDHKRIINQINLSIYEGQSIAFTGHNGSGKSTMLKIIAGLVKPSGGRVVTGTGCCFIMYRNVFLK
ncbi:MAG: ATP-binding cassette domain-containing protein [Blautia marasmi]